MGESLPQIMLVDVKLDGKRYTDKQVKVHGMQAGESNRKKKAKAIDVTADHLNVFLQNNATAKVLVVITMHCIEDTGMFVCGGATGACDMREVRILLFVFFDCSLRRI